MEIYLYSSSLELLKGSLEGSWQLRAIGVRHRMLWPLTSPKWEEELIWHCRTCSHWYTKGRCLLPHHLSFKRMLHWENGFKLLKFLLCVIQAFSSLFSLWSVALVGGALLSLVSCICEMRLSYPHVPIVQLEDARGCRLARFWRPQRLCPSHLLPCLWLTICSVLCFSLKPRLYTSLQA